MISRLGWWGWHLPFPDFPHLVDGNDEPGDVCQRLVRAEPGQILDPEVGQGSALAVVAVLQYQHQPCADLAHEEDDINTKKV